MELTWPRTRDTTTEYTSPTEHTTSWCPWHTCALCVLSSVWLASTLPVQNQAAYHIFPLHFSLFHALLFSYSFCEFCFISCWTLSHLINAFHIFCVGLGKPPFNFAVWFGVPTIHYLDLMLVSTPYECHFSSKSLSFLERIVRAHRGRCRPMHDCVFSVKQDLRVSGTIMFQLSPWYLCTDCLNPLLQIMPRKHIAFKKPRIKAPTPVTDYIPIFHTQSHQDHYARLSRRCFRESREIDWDVLHEVGLEAEVQGLLSAGAWQQLFQITDNTYEQLALEVLATFELS